ncbi:hypothetical protein NDU88_002026 [Pleurodeles waltl]|uniref:Uncharacterized protein n=1 Tax=Pleurodeles waltl TaxID=8319 RepID=A0AAV7SC19_PLEWA|nr:hypothetical protein NDU88_002026 [Pleurodeles waltl]
MFLHCVQIALIEKEALVFKNPPKYGHAASQHPEACHPPPHWRQERIATRASQDLRGAPFHTGGHTSARQPVHVLAGSEATACTPGCPNNLRLPRSLRLGDMGCRNWGFDHRTPGVCRAKEKAGSKCGKLNHFAKVCRGRRPRSGAAAARRATV